MVKPHFDGQMPMSSPCLPFLLCFGTARNRGAWMVKAQAWRQKASPHGPSLGWKIMEEPMAKIGRLVTYINIVLYMYNSFGHPGVYEGIQYLGPF